MVVIDKTTSPFIWEFSGMSFIIPVTLAGLPSPVINKVCPIGSSFPKYFFAAVSLNTILNGSFNAVVGFPFNNLKSKTLNKAESAHITLLSWYLILPFLINTLSPPAIRTKDSISGNSFLAKGGTAQDGPDAFITSVGVLISDTTR